MKKKTGYESLQKVLRKKTGYENLLKVLKKHTDRCKMHEFSLQEKRHCSCGVEGGRRELDRILAAANFIVMNKGSFLVRDTDGVSGASIDSLYRAINSPIE